MNLGRAAAALLLAAACTVGTAACTGDDQAQPAAGSSASSGATESGGHNGADVTFATEMIPHHAQALVMVAMTKGWDDLSPEFVALTDQIREAQAPEIDQMSGWLEDWGEEVPQTSGRHMQGGGMGGVGGMGGMMSSDDLRRLDGASPAFERMWLRMMIRHHQGAIEMARTEVDEGEYPPALDLAQSIIESQTAEIRTMREMLGS